MTSIVNTLLDRLNNLTREHERLLRLNQDLKASLETVEDKMLVMEHDKNREIERLREKTCQNPDRTREEDFRIFKLMLHNATLDGPNGAYIQAIKLARNLGGLGLADSKHLVDSLHKGH